MGICVNSNVIKPVISGVAKSGEYIYKANKYKIMTVIIDQSNPNPETCCTYADDAAGMTPGSSAWDDFFGHYPVMLLNGVEGKKLNRNDFTKYEDGTVADITSGNEGDVMIACPRRGVRISTLGNIVTVSMTDNPNDPNFEYNAHTRGTVSKNIFYLGAYKGSELNNKLRSLSDQMTAKNKTISEFRTIAQANGKSDGTSSGYDQGGWFQLIFRQVMYLLKFKNLNSQKAIGFGCIGSTHAPWTGETNTYGMDSELVKLTNPSYMTDGKHQVKCLGWEAYWGSIREFIEGLATDGSYNIMTATTNFNDEMTGYENQGKVSGKMDGYIKTIQGATKTGFLVKEATGNSVTYFSDNGYLVASRLSDFGGGWDAHDAAGVFCLSIGDALWSANTQISSRLMYL